MKCNLCLGQSQGGLFLLQVGRGNDKKNAFIIGKTYLIIFLLLNLSVAGSAGSINKLFSVLIYYFNACWLTSTPSFLFADQRRYFLLRAVFRCNGLILDYMKSGGSPATGLV